MRTASIAWISTFALGPLLGACVEASSPSPSLSPSSPMETQVTEPAELVLTGGSIHTMQPAAPQAEAVAIRGGRITAVGTAGEVRAFIGPGTRVIELKGRTVTPGLVDAHCHLYGLGIALETLSLRGQKSPEAIAKLVAAEAKTRPEGEWISGRGWDQNLFTPAQFPGHAPLDAAAPKHPVALERVDGHAVWANAAAMRAAGVSRATQDPPGGKILRDAAGEPTGVFIDHAMSLIEVKMPPDPPAQRARRILRAAELAVSLGLTGVHEMGIDDETVAVYRSLVGEKRLPLRVYAYLSGGGQVDSLPSRKPDIDPDGTAMFVLRGVKLFADGALGSRGAALLAPYNDDAGNTGLMLTSPEELRRAAKIAAESGFQLAVHAIGDRANRVVLDAFEAAKSAPAGTGKDLRFRIEHAQVVAPEDIGRFAKLGVIASMQPAHATSDMPWAEARVGPSRIRGAYAWRSILRTGAHIAFGSDFPVEETSPLLGVYAAMTRQDAKGNPPAGFRPEERLTLEEALRAFTAESAYASFVEGYRGSIAKGFIADLTVFDRALSPGMGVLEASAAMVIIGGRVARDVIAD
jgi:predicted amidohydrolase YtcJ